ncbi:hypothetical protein [Cryobacterium sp. TMT2-23]|uniref:hypothetical protein n=1 Tax=Cryobacterium sp. TMT2-23 TaxID=1259252 RepID=UPI00106D7A90|nr:hypothetical protein [Cryobacterium sp. TMT2-23]TFD29139.1 hypothetical protein E3T32_00245 [Cryobacterium sp. TMT2-23]
MRSAIIGGATGALEIRSRLSMEKPGAWGPPRFTHPEYLRYNSYMEIESKLDTDIQGIVTVYFPSRDSVPQLLQRSPIQMTEAEISANVVEDDAARIDAVFRRVRRSELFLVGIQYGTGLTEPNPNTVDGMWAQS